MRELTIGEAARQADVGIETVRFYERRGLVEKPPKPPGSGFRVYSPEQIKRIRFIRQAQQIGFSLREIQDLLSLRADPAADCSAIRGQAVAKLEEVKRKIEQLDRIGAALESLIASCPGHGALKTCTILDTLIDGDHGSARHASGGLEAVPPERKKPTQILGQRSRKSRIKDSRVKSITLQIQGMHCIGCANTIQAMVERQQGVRSVAVNLKASQARVLYDPAVISEDRLAATVELPGYRVTGRLP